MSTDLSLADLTILADVQDRERWRQQLVAALRLHGARHEWETTEEAVYEAALTLQANRKTIAELHQILGTKPHQSILDRAREVAAALQVAERVLAEKEARIGDLDGSYKKLLTVTAGPQFERICYLEAALAAAHEALGSAYWVLLRIDLAGDLGEAVAGARRLVDAALSAPALAVLRAEEERG